LDSLFFVFFESAFITEQTEEQQKLWVDWLRLYLEKINEENQLEDEDRVILMNKTNPKYVRPFWLFLHQSIFPPIIMRLSRLPAHLTIRYKSGLFTPLHNG
jgi:hypothetical protein